MKINIPFLNQEANQSLNRLLKHLNSHNRLYRVFTLLAISIIWAQFSYTNIFSFNFIGVFILAVLPTYFITLYIIDSKFRQYMRVIEQKKAKRQNRLEQKTLHEKKLNQMYLSGIVKLLPKFFLCKLLPHLTRLPIIKDYYQDNFYHHDNKVYRDFVSILEGKAKNQKVKVTRMFIDQYHVTYYISWNKSITPSKVKKTLSNRLTRHFKVLDQNILFNFKSKQGQVLIPVELLKEK